ncbi:MAG: ISAs1 family transposase [Chlamydiota bacterium]
MISQTGFVSPETISFSPSITVKSLYLVKNEKCYAQEANTLFSYLESIPDPRKKRGVRYHFQSILKLVILGFVSRMVCLEHIVEWAENNWEVLKTALGFNRETPPNATTIGRVLKKIHRESLENAFRLWVSTCAQVKERVLTASVDGKALRNVCNEKGNPLFAVNIFAHDIQLSLAQAEIEDKKGESTTLRAMLEGLFKTYPGLRILTGDAAFSGRDLCKEITRLGRHYIVQVKGNQGAVEEVLKLHFDEEREERPADAQTIDEKRVLKEKIVREIWVCAGEAASYVREELNFESASQVAYIRKTTYQNEIIVKQEDRYGITSMKKEELCPQSFLEKTRQHWEVENGLHHVKDRSWYEDHQYSKDMEKGAILGVLRNLGLNIMRVLSPPNPDRKKRKREKSLPKQAIAYLTNPLRTLEKLCII